MHKETGLNYAELESLFRRIAAILNSRPISAKYGSRQMDAEPDYLEVITPNMLLTGRSAMALPSREFTDESCPLRRLAHRLELERAWWDRWSVNCFDSLLPCPSQKWTKEVRSLKIGDLVLIKYSDKS